MQDVAAGEAGDRVEGLDVEPGAIHDAAAVLEHLVLLGEGRDRLGYDDGVALDQRESDRPLEQVVDVLRPGLLGGELGEAVLDDLELGVRLAELRPQLGSLRDADALVVDGEDRLGFAEVLGELIDYGCLLVALHLSPCNGRARTKRRAREKRLPRAPPALELRSESASGLRKA